MTLGPIRMPRPPVAPRLRLGVMRACALTLLALVHDADAMELADNVVDIVEAGLPCQWSPVVSVGGFCTGAYVGNRLVITAAHCIDDIDTLDEQGPPTAFVFADSSLGSDDVVRFEISAERCRAHPGFPVQDEADFDIGWCYLAEEPPLVAPIPVMVPDRCEAKWVSRQVMGAAPQPLRVTSVGMGCHEFFDPNNESCPEGPGRKRYTSFEVRNPPAGGLVLEPVWVDWDAELDQVVAAGDSGGPLYLRLPDGTWRLVAIHSIREAGDSLNVPVPTYVSWIEKSSGVDITPCHELDENDGNWGRYTFTNDQNCSAAHSVDPLPTASDDVDWTDGCSTPLSGPDPELASECAHWPIPKNQLRSPLP